LGGGSRNGITQYVLAARDIRDFPAVVELRSRVRPVALAAEVDLDHVPELLGEMERLRREIEV